MNYFLGIDGGATKTEAVILDENGQVVAQALGGPVNYHQGGEKESAENLEELMKKILNQANLEIKDITAAICGLAGLDTKQDQRVLGKMAKNLLSGDLKEKIKVVSDVEIAFALSITKDYGIVLISGTGANCFGKGENGKISWAGKWGYLLGDQASGFALGLGALKMIMRGFDGRGKKPKILTKLILDKLKLKEVEEIMDWIYRDQVPVREIAALAPLVFEAYKKGDKVTLILIKKLIYEMVLDIKTVATKVDLLNEEFEIGLVGGVFKERLVIELLEKEIKKILPKTKLVLPKISPAMAAAKMAKQNSQ